MNDSGVALAEVMDSFAATNADGVVDALVAFSCVVVCVDGAVTVFLVAVFLLLKDSFDDFVVDSFLGVAIVILDMPVGLFTASDVDEPVVVVGF